MVRELLALSVLAVASACATAIASRSERSDVAAPAPATALAAAPAPQNWFADVTLGGGTYDHDTKGSNADGDTDAGYLRLRGEYIVDTADAGIGGGLAIEGAVSDDDLFDNTDTTGSMSDLFMFFAFVPHVAPEFRLPIRVGPYLHVLELDEDSTNSTIDWDGFGMRAEVEPELWLIQRDRFSFGVVGDFSIGAHVTSINVDVPGNDDDYDGNGTTFGAEVGVQALFNNHITTRLSYLYRMTNEDESDTNNGLRVREATATFSGIALAVGVRF